MFVLFLKRMVGESEVLLVHMAAQKHLKYHSPVLGIKQLGTKTFKFRWLILIPPQYNVFPLSMLRNS